MFGLFESPLFRDPDLGEFKRSRGHWRGRLAVAREERVPLVLYGSRKEPDPQAVAMARDLSSAIKTWRPCIESALFEHYEPYAEADAAGESSSSAAPVPTMKMAGEVWPHVSFEFVSITPLAGVVTVELGFTVAWDEEHTVGVRFREGEFLELNGSILPP